MLNKPLPILFWSVCTLLCFGCSGNDPQPEPEEPQLDKYPELVSACADWKGGGGSASIGGYNSSAVYTVSSLEDADPYKPQPGTIRYAINQSGPRVVIFKVSGTIHLKAPLEITNANITVLGQTAPAGGICIADYPIIIKKTHDVTLRYIRCRLGNASLQKDAETDYDALSVNDCRNIMIDHCSFSWSVDECVSCYGNENFTLQYCFVTESLRDAGHVKGAHGYGGIWGGKNATFHHNLLAHHDSRNPRFDHDYVDTKCAGPIDFVNNVVYDWGGNSAYGGEGSSNGAGGRHINFMANYYKPGPATKSGVRTRLLNPTTKCGNCTEACGGSMQPGKFYLEGNIMDGAPSVNSDNWSGVYPDEASKLEQCKASSRWTEGMTLLPDEQTADAAYETVLAKAGCSLSRDAVDARIVNEIKNGSGKLIDKPSDVGGWPDLTATYAVVTDTDSDGIPDEWEEKYGLNPNNVLDATKITLVTGYTNIEVYACDLVQKLY